MEDNKYVLEVSDLHTTFKTDNGDVAAVNGVSFNLEPGKTLGIVGESGSGKSVSAYSIMQILADNGKITGGKVLFKGEDIVTWDKKKNYIRKIGLRATNSCVSASNSEEHDENFHRLIKQELLNKYGLNLCMRHAPT